MRLCYFWKDGEVVTWEGFTNPDEEGGYRNLFCVDTSEKEPEQRYGKFMPSWAHVPFDQFPAEFRVHLLLLGVS